MILAAPRIKASLTPREELIAQLETEAQRIRQYAVAGIYHAGSGHPGGSLSCADILAYLYGAELNLSPASFKPGQIDEARDRFILSKGHAAPALYGAAAVHDFIAPRLVKELRKFRSPLQGHPHVIDVPFAETSTGSLGQGFSVAIGIALGLRYQQNKARTYVLLGDGELQEGEVWEGAMCAAHHKLDNLCAIVDYNKMQSDDLNANIMGLEPLPSKWEAFGWTVVEIDGHDFEGMLNAFEIANETKDAPTVIIAHTVKGQGVSYMEGQPLWHGSVKLSDEDTARALEELGLEADEIRSWMDGTIS